MADYDGPRHVDDDAAAAVRLELDDSDDPEGDEDGQFELDEVGVTALFNCTKCSIHDGTMLFFQLLLLHMQQED